MNESPQHEWFLFSGIWCCKKCGVVQRRDGKNKPCKGKMAPVGPRRERPSGHPNETKRATAAECERGEGKESR